MDQAEDLLSIAEAAKRLQVSRVTLWRWIQSGRLKAYRLGPRKVRIRQSDLGDLLKPLEASNRQNADIRAAVREVERVQAQIFRRRGGRPVTDSADLLNQAREERESEL